MRIALTVTPLLSLVLQRHHNNLTGCLRKSTSGSQDHSVRSLDALPDWTGYAYVLRSWRFNLCASRMSLSPFDALFRCDVIVICLPMTATAR